MEGKMLGEGKDEGEHVRGEHEGDEGGEVRGLRRGRGKSSGVVELEGWREGGARAI